MYTLGYRFRPWVGPKAIADGPSILDYVRDTAREDGIDRHIRFGHRVRARVVVERRRALDASRPEGAARAHLRLPVRLQRLLPLRPGLPARVRRASSDFEGQVVHPQFWPEDLDYAGKRVVVIGSGATAVTLVPALAEPRRARHDAAALADVHHLDPVGRPDRQRAAAGCSGRARVVSDRALEERRCSRRSSTRPAGAGRRCMRALIRARRDARAARRLRRRHPLQPALRPVGPATVPGARRRPVQGDLAPAARSMVTDRDRALHADRHPARVRTRARGRHRRHRDRPEPARVRRHRARRSTASRCRCPSTSPTRG